MASAKSDNKNDEEKMEETAYNTVFYKHFADYCKDIHKSLAKKEIKKSNKFSKIDKKEVINCGLLSKGVYNASLYSPLLKNTNVDLDSSKAYQSEKNEMTEWGFLVNKETKTGYIVFRGTAGETLGIDVLTDISIVPTPIWCDDDKRIDPKTENRDENKQQDTETKNNDWKDFRKGHNHRWDFAVHGGIYSSVLRVFGLVLNELDKKGNTFDKLYITGHSLGGGLAILFGLELLLKRIINPNKIDCKIIVFGAPNVISLEKPIKDIPSGKAQQLLTRLHSMTHCFVNRFDVVPRIPSAWILEVLLPSMPDIAQLAIQNNTIGLLQSFAIKHFSPSYFDAAKQSFKQHKKILNTFKSFGTFYILLNDKQKNAFIIDDCADIAVIRQILSFIPPISTNIQGKDGILAHYFYQFIEQIDFDNGDQTQKLIKQRKLEFGDEIWWPIPYDSVNEYSQMKRYLFQAGDWTKLICDHYVDNYLNGIIDQELQNTLHLKSKMEYLKLFDIGIECGSGKAWWNDDKIYYFEDVCGILKLQIHSQSSQSNWFGNVIQTARKYGTWSNHDDTYRIIMKSKIFTDDKWKELYHSNNLKELKQKFTKTKEIMNFYQNKS